jgi:predicted Zn-dependent protease
MITIFVAEHYDTQYGWQLEKLTQVQADQAEAKLAELRNQHPTLHFEKSLAYA